MCIERKETERTTSIRKIPRALASRHSSLVRRPPGDRFHCVGRLLVLVWTRRLPQQFHTSPASQPGQFVGVGPSAGQHARNFGSALNQAGRLSIPPDTEYSIDHGFSSMTGQVLEKKKLKIG